jgi:hypothetical protein
MHPREVVRRPSEFHFESSHPVGLDPNPARVIDRYLRLSLAAHCAASSVIRRLAPDHGVDGVLPIPDCTRQSIESEVTVAEVGFDGSPQRKAFSSLRFRPSGTSN